MKPFGEWLKERRLGRALSLYGLSVAAGASSVTIDYWERGKGLPSAKKLKQLLEALHVSPEQFYAEVDVTSWANARNLWR